jgi:hypothetical protein
LVFVEGVTGQPVVVGDQRRGFRLTNRVVNPCLRHVLRSRIGHRLGRRLAVLDYRGKRTGELRELVVMYVRNAGRVWILVGWPQRKRWWRNLLEPTPVNLRLAGRNETGVAQAISDREQPEEVGEALAAYLQEFPRARHSVDRNDGPTVMVRIDLHDKEGSG